MDDISWQLSFTILNIIESFISYNDLHERIKLHHKRHNLMAAELLATEGKKTDRNYASLLTISKEKLNGDGLA